MRSSSGIEKTPPGPRMVVDCAIGHELPKDKKTMTKVKEFKGNIRPSKKFPNSRLLVETDKFNEIKEIAPHCFKQAKVKYSLLQFVQGQEEPDLTDEERAAGDH